MKHPLLCLALLSLPVSTWADDYNITVERKRTGGVQSSQRLKATSKGSAIPTEQVLAQKWTGQVQIENRTRKESPELTAKYMVIVKRQQLGQLAGKDEVDIVSGVEKVAPLRNLGKALFETKEVDLSQHALQGNFYFVNGGITRAADQISGVWIKLFDGDREVYEYANPSTIKGRHKFQ